ncbi:glycosyltransferase [Thiotrichales bacterium 19S3-7]|nr:glycosyltransferase [Thiotrichales bacterium 19S3-7]MCF6801487.1 glycosyltransferase [Thiotrichales bacterium 19S3-11]
MTKKHIVFFLEKLSIGGIERVVLTLAETMIKNFNCNVYLVTLRKAQDYDINFHVNQIQLPLIKKPKIRLFSNRYFKQLANCFDQTIAEIENTNQFKFDLVLSNKKECDRILTYSRYPRDNVYSVLHIALSWQTNLENKSGISRWLKLHRYQKIYNHKNLITVSNGIQKDAINTMKIKPNSIQTIYNPFDFDQINRLASMELPIAVNKPYIVYLGRFSEHQKRIGRLLKAYYLSKIDAKLILIGKGNKTEKANIKKWISEHQLDDNVVIAGFYQNPYPLLKNANLLVVSSDFEGFCNVIVEALACDTPVVSTNCLSGPSEILTDEMAKGLSELTAESLAKKIKEVYTKPYPINIDRLKAKFSADRIAKQYLSIGD